MNVCFWSRCCSRWKLHDAAHLCLLYLYTYTYTNTPQFIYTRDFIIMVLYIWENSRARIQSFQSILHFPGADSTRNLRLFFTSLPPLYALNRVRIHIDAYVYILFDIFILPNIHCFTSTHTHKLQPSTHTQSLIYIYVLLASKTLYARGVYTQKLLLIIRNRGNDAVYVQYFFLKSLKSHSNLLQRTSATNFMINLAQELFI